ncbi:hypothetical protein GX51_01685 [Blastomyces parvus]|uniref:HNH nuclease domain-containing protein n=1 Tax=Blastomyces parvus TaxID=2060905 RepID=A0A2B7XEU8_9EURO|nr:hypothetical protein GX51_01685 [Blastomyces parvus]
MESVKRFFNDQRPLSSVPIEFDEHEAELILEGYQPRDNKDRTKDVLSSFLRFLPGEGRTALADFIVTTGQDHETLHALSQHLKTTLLIPMRARGATPPISPTSFRMEKEVQEVAATMDEPASRKDQRRLKKLCLERDGHRCLATGAIDINAEIPEADTEYVVPTDLCHIIPFSLRRWEKSEDYQITQIWATLKKLFPQIQLRPEDVNDPTNLITLASPLHAAFYSFTLAFEPTVGRPSHVSQLADDTNCFVHQGEPNQYQILLLGKRRNLLIQFLFRAPQGGPDGSRLVTFERHGGATIELPSPALLRMHSALAKILHASGMAKYIEDLVRGEEDIGCLAEGGTTNLEDLVLLRMLKSRCEWVN